MAFFKMAGLQLVLACGLFHAAVCQSTGSCSYETHKEGIAVKCKGLTKFPSQFSNQTYMIGFCDSQVDEIPSQAFRGLPRLHSVEIHNSRIGAIREFAFRDFDGVSNIQIFNSQVKDIDSFAFSNIKHIARIFFFNSSFGCFHEHAFHQITGVYEITFRNVTIACFYPKAFSYVRQVAMWTLANSYIGTIKTGAFHESSPAFLHIRGNTFEELRCGSIDVAVEAAMNDVDIANNQMCCGCHVLWMLQPDTRTRLWRFLEGLTCSNYPVGEDGVVTPVSQLTWDNIPCEDEADRGRYNTTFCPTQTGPTVQALRLDASLSAAATTLRMCHLTHSLALVSVTLAVKYLASVGGTF